MTTATTARDAFAAAWDARHPNRPDHKWEANPWVWVATFRWNSSSPRPSPQRMPKP